ncbi:MAG: RAD55 family ATPase, partial [Pyrobaculum sp.]
MREFAEASQEGLTLIYGPPGAGKTSIAIKLADRLAKRVMWISTTESPKLLAQTAKRVGADPEKFAFLDFPRAFREDIVKYVMEHANEYDLIAVDSINGLSASIPTLEKIVHSVLYQISQDKPVVLISEEEPQKLHYIADHVIHVWHKKNSIGHIIRYAQLEKSRKLPPGPRYVFEIVDELGIVYLYPRSSEHERARVLNEELGIELPHKSEICIGAENVGQLVKVLTKIKDKAMFINIGPWVAYRGLEVSEGQEITASTFHDMFKV